MKQVLKAFALFAIMNSGAQAAILTYGVNHSGASSVDSYAFNVDAGNSAIVNVYTNAPTPYNPYLTLWTTTSSNPAASDWVKVASNDNTTTFNFTETTNSLNAQIKQALAGGSYLATITGSGYTPAGNLLSDGFTGTSNQTFFPVTLKVIGNVSVAPAAVPLPAAVWLFGSAMMGFLGFSKRKSGKMMI
jgi:hypothetical protein